MGLRPGNSSDIACHVQPLLRRWVMIRSSSDAHFVFPLRRIGDFGASGLSGSGCGGSSVIGELVGFGATGPSGEQRSLTDNTVAVVRRALYVKRQWGAASGGGLMLCSIAGNGAGIWRIISSTPAMLGWCFADLCVVGISEGPANREERSGEMEIGMIT